MPPKGSKRGDYPPRGEAEGTPPAKRRRGHDASMYVLLLLAVVAGRRMRETNKNHDKLLVYVCRCL
jgi:hypothetical protein